MSYKGIPFLEYLVFYSDSADVPDKDWILDGVKGDRLSISLTNLLPRTTYFFKVQARNAKGYGPFSPTLQYVPGGPPPRLFQVRLTGLRSQYLRNWFPTNTLLLLTAF